MLLFSTESKVHTLPLTQLHHSRERHLAIICGIKISFRTSKIQLSSKEGNLAIFLGMGRLHLKYNYSILEGILPITWEIKSLFSISNATIHTREGSLAFIWGIKVHSVPQTQLLKP